MKQSLQLRLGQQLTMTPQLQQAVRMLQLSSLDLQAEIQQALENNPLLESEEHTTIQAATGQQVGEHPDQEWQSAASSEPEQQPDDHFLPDTWPQTRKKNNITMPDMLPDYPAEQHNIRQHLASQLTLMELSTTDRIIASSITDSISDDGYLKMTLDELLASFTDIEEIGREEILAVLHRIQHLDPPGIAALDLQDCLHIQLQTRQLEQPDNTLDIALEIIDNHFELLAQRDLGNITKILGLDLETAEEAFNIIRQLNPRPGYAIDSTPTQYIAPDVLIRKHAGHWRVYLNHDIAPQLKVNDLYAGMIKRADDSRDNLFLKNHLQEARWFIKSLNNRNDTLLRVADVIVQQQQDFLEHGEEYMKPLVLQDVAESVNLHESTISRVTSHKYIHTPRGIFEFKYFFSSHVNTTGGGECSSTAIRAMIKKLVTSEDNCKPLSDNKLAQILETRGIKIARRTITKYRESLMIPPSNERRLRV